MILIAGRLSLPDVMAHLATRRPVFHSEADFQFAFAQAVTDLDPTVRVRLEVPQRTERRTYVDLTCTGEVTSLIELKYFTRYWNGTDGHTPEMFALRGHAAHDLARLHFIHDVTRLEAWTREQPDTNGFTVMLTNDQRLWKEAPPSARPVRDAQYRIHQGRTVTGDLTWGTADRPHLRNDRTLRGAYTANWADYSHLDSTPGGVLRWLGWAVTA